MGRPKTSSSRGRGRLRRIRRPGPANAVLDRSDRLRGRLSVGLTVCEGTRHNPRTRVMSPSADASSTGSGAARGKAGPPVRRSTARGRRCLPFDERTKGWLSASRSRASTARTACVLSENRQWPITNFATLSLGATTVDLRPTSPQVVHLRTRSRSRRRLGCDQAPESSTCATGAGSQARRRPGRRALDQGKPCCSDRGQKGLAALAADAEPGRSARRRSSVGSRR